MTTQGFLSFNQNSSRCFRDISEGGGQYNGLLFPATGIVLVKIVLFSIRKSKLCCLVLGNLYQYLVLEHLQFWTNTLPFCRFHSRPSPSVIHYSLVCSQLIWLYLSFFCIAVSRAFFGLFDWNWRFLKFLKMLQFTYHLKRSFSFVYYVFTFRSFIDNGWLFHDHKLKFWRLKCVWGAF